MPEIQCTNHTFIIQRVSMATTLPAAHNPDLESVCLVWLDASANTSAENIATQKQFRTITHHFKIFQTVYDCEQYIQQKPRDDRIFFICSGQLGREIVPRIHHYRQIFAIYVYCQNKQANEEWANKFSKVIHSFCLTFTSTFSIGQSCDCQTRSPYPTNSIRLYQTKSN